MSEPDRQQHASHVGQIGGISGRQRALFSAAIVLGLGMLVWITVSGGDVPAVADLAPSGASTVGQAASPTPVSSLASPSPAIRPSAGPPAPVLPGDPEGPWAATAVDFRAAVGESFEFVCPGNGTFSQVWGSAVYTDDSSVCTAAVHHGYITVREGGTVQVVIRPGLASYAGTSLNGVTTESWPAWEGSFEIVGLVPPFEEAPPPSVEGPWSAHAMDHRGRTGERFEYDCPPGGSPGPIWGTGIYTDDSSVCTAAVLAGHISFVDGGRVTIEMRPGRHFYVGTRRQVVRSGAWGQWDGSFVIVAPGASAQ